MTLGLADRQDELFDEVVRFRDETLAERSIYVLLHRERERLFPDKTFARADLPIISIDAKKRELVGNFKNQGTT